MAYRPDPDDQNKDISFTTGDEFAGLTEARFESAVVESILARFGERASFYRNMLRRRVQHDGTGPYFTYYAFHDEFAGRGLEIPLYLFCRHWSSADKLLTVQVLDESFEKTKIAEEFLSLAEEMPEEGAEYGMVFFWPRLKRCKTKQGGALLLHNTGSPYSAGGYYGHTVLNQQELWLEPLARVLDTWEAGGIFMQELND